MYVVAANGVAVVHCVESGHLVDTHGRHLEHSGDFVHDADAGEAVLALSEVEQRHDSGFLVLRGVSCEDFLDELLILGVELERDARVVFGRVTVLEGLSVHVPEMLYRCRAGSGSRDIPLAGRRFVESEWRRMCVALLVRLPAALCCHFGRPLA